ncbi:MAG: YebC/PmpR family DNA-binding transcriptional regulator [Chlamydiae bacterium]|nr:YebC/PmpR family DNA-binding transcriptional regulator [Chlamydiota bacterium]
MAGHSKWANIKHKKGKMDAAKGKVFTRVTKEIINAVKQGGPDPKSNPKLRLALQKAKAVNLPSDNIERNIKKATSKDQADYVEVTYELYGHGGVGLLVEIMTDNKNRTASDMRIATNKRGGTIASPGSVAFNFGRKGVLQVAKADFSEEALLDIIMDAGAEDFDQNEEMYLVMTSPEDLYKVKEALETKEMKVEEAGFEQFPKVYVSCDEENKKANLALIEWLEEMDDVDAVYHNMQMEEE